MIGKRIFIILTIIVICSFILCACVNSKDNTKESVTLVINNKSIEKSYDIKLSDVKKDNGVLSLFDAVSITYDVDENGFTYINNEKVDSDNIVIYTSNAEDQADYDGVKTKNYNSVVLKQTLSKLTNIKLKSGTIIYIEIK